MSDDGRRLFLSTLQEACLQTGWIVHAYVLMSNHYHLLFETPEANLVSGMKWLQGTYTQRFNAMFERRGHLFQGRYKALPIETSSEGYFREVGQYIHLNPFRAGLVGIGMKQPIEAYIWSSCPYYTGKRRNVPKWLCRSRFYSACGLEQGKPGYLSAYRALLESRMLGKCDKLQDGPREAVEYQLRRGWFVGSKAFGADLAAQITEVSDNLRGAQRRAHDESEAERLFAVALSLLGISEQALLELKSTSLEKQAVAWLMKKHTTVTGIWIAKRLRMGHRVTASRAISAFDRRSDQAADSLKERMLQCTG